jgi:hypothetical protein
MEAKIGEMRRAKLDEENGARQRDDMGAKLGEMKRA